MKNTIMIVDDDSDNLYILAQLLSDMDYIVKPFISPVEGLDYLSQNSDIDLIILDMQMPQMSGCEFYQTMNQDATIHSAPTLFYTGHREAEVRELCEEENLQILAKPLNFQQLNQWLDKLL